MTSTLRELLERSATAYAVVLAALCGVATSACSAPASEASLARTRGDSPFASSLSASPSAASGAAGSTADGQKARIGETPRESRSGNLLRGRCPEGMADIEGRFCIDRYEATLMDVLSNGEERVHSPFSPVAETRVRAVSARSVFPQGYISAVEAQRACNESGKRLCRVAEWGKACRGPDARSFGYGERREPGRCNDNGKNPVLSLYGRGHWNWSTMNQPLLNQQDGTLAKTGEHSGCTNGYGVYDMVGNLHEWVADPSGTFYGGYYQDVSSKGHGEGCGYLTTAHEARYHDYSTGFRCCADVAGTASAEHGSPAAQPRSSRPRSKR